jgi:hypothetical protein
MPPDRITHIPTVRTLGQFVPEIRQSNIWAVLLNQPVDPRLPRAATLGATEAKHVQVSGGLAQRIGTVGHRHNLLSRRSARCISAVAVKINSCLSTYLQDGHTNAERPHGPLGI